MDSDDEVIYDSENEYNTLKNKLCTRCNKFNNNSNYKTCQSCQMKRKDYYIWKTYYFNK